MLNYEDISFQINCQGFVGDSWIVTPDERQSVIVFESRSTAAYCPVCGKRAHIYGQGSTTLTDAPIWVERKQELCFVYPRYRCRSCGKTFHEEVPERYPNTMITNRAARWIQQLLYHRISISGVASIMGICWDTVRKVHRDFMEKKLLEHDKTLAREQYKPKHLAVDEFAIHKGHTYATCVMDLDRGDIIWVGNGRSVEDFAHFFEAVSAEYLSEVEAFAMDMNASYNKLVKKHLPQARIVYDRFHMQAQYGKEVLGAVRLEEAQRHKRREEELRKEANGKDKEESRHLYQQAAEERNAYSTLKKGRWPLLMNREHLSKRKQKHLELILEKHSDVSVCYAMKEEMIELYKLRDPIAASKGWNKWYDAAEASGIAPLVRFAQLKRARIDGLVAHALFPIGTNKLEGFNNKIKVAKRVAFGYRDDSYFFTLIRFLALPLD